MSNPTQESPQPSLVGDDVLCLGCGYMLRGLSPAGACPECGQAIALSLGPARLCDLDPAWLRRVRRGLRLVAAGLLLFFILPLATLSATIHFGFATDFLVAAVLAPTVLLFAGVILCCMPAESTDQIEVIRVARQRLRFRTILLGTTIGVAAGLFIFRLARSDAWLVSVSIALFVEIAFASHAYAKWLRVLFDRRSGSDPREPRIAPEMVTVASITPISIILGPVFFVLSMIVILIAYACVLFATRRVIIVLNRAIAHREAR